MNAPGVWKYGHGIVVKALKSEIERCGIKVDISDKSLHCNYSHPESDKYADGVALADRALLVTDLVPGKGMVHPACAFDVNLDSIVDGTGKWRGSRDPSRQNDSWRHTMLGASESAKYRKHEEGYASQDLGFLAFAASSFGVLG
eukprot:CAMPEP_0113680896 /NCGR_PEP_ID=MMETSP0038_2-20120614/11624_1 /TAXON_ID=2898 /ORGANISM="Cryptomonas paramecium" /LENGTH=143 /DNA_ID=CAMNT_0000599429 /DNA_START=73 /DNA_END=501 /DNA_ORIENTATION=- /assembly_acc=CAM_ASM_000170